MMLFICKIENSLHFIVRKTFQLNDILVTSLVMWNGSGNVCKLMTDTQRFIDDSFECCCVAVYDLSSGRASIRQRNGDSTVNLVKTRKKVKSDRIPNQNFEPSMKLLLRIMKVILESNSTGKTSLSQEANINYHRLCKHLDWLEQKHLIEYALENGKVRIRLTESGRQFERSFRI